MRAGGSMFTEDVARLRHQIDIGKKVGTSGRILLSLPLSLRFTIETAIDAVVKLKIDGRNRLCERSFQ